MNQLPPDLAKLQVEFDAQDNTTARLEKRGACRRLWVLFPIGANRRRSEAHFGLDAQLQNQQTRSQGSLCDFWTKIFFVYFNTFDSCNNLLTPLDSNKAAFQGSLLNCPTTALYVSLANPSGFSLNTDLVDLSAISVNSDWVFFSRMQNKAPQPQTHRLFKLSAQVHRFECVRTADRGNKKLFQDTTGKLNFSVSATARMTSHTSQGCVHTSLFGQVVTGQCKNLKTSECTEKSICARCKIQMRDPEANFSQCKNEYDESLRNVVTVLRMFFCSLRVQPRH